MPVAHNVVRINGNMPSGEVWSITPKFGATGFPLIFEYADLLAWATNIGGLNEGAVLPDGIRASMSAYVSVTEIVTEYRDASGELAQSARFTLPTPAVGSGSVNKTFQTAIVSSLLTGRPGRSYRGRIYWPAQSAAISTTTGRLSAEFTDAYAASVAAFLSAVQSAGPEGSSPELSVVSQTISEVTPVTQIQVGDVLDTQRRRRDSLLELRSTIDFPPA